MISKSQRIAMIILALLTLTLLSGCKTNHGSFQPNPNGVMEVSIDQSIIVPAGGVTYFNDAGEELRNDREFRLPYKWRIVRPKQ